jgi:hypothetical protein
LTPRTEPPAPAVSACFFSLSYAANWLSLFFFFISRALSVGLVAYAQRLEKSAYLVEFGKVIVGGLNVVGSVHFEHTALTVLQYSSFKFLFILVDIEE